MINTFVAGLLCGWMYVTFVVPMYQVSKLAEPKQCTLKFGNVLVQGDAV
jgi:hypothetical protein